MVSTMITFHVPEDTQLLAAFGEVALRHEHLNHILKMTIKTLARLRPQEALDATTYDGSRQLRECIRKLARQRLGEGEALLKLEALLERCRRVTEKRNELTHGIWAKELDGEPMRRGPDHNWHPLPTADELKALANQTWLLTDELNSARLDGFLQKLWLSADSNPMATPATPNLTVNRTRRHTPSCSRTLARHAGYLQR